MAPPPRRCIKQKAGQSGLAGREGYVRVASTWAWTGSPSGELWTERPSARAPYNCRPRGILQRRLDKSSCKMGGGVRGLKPQEEAVREGGLITCSLQVLEELGGQEVETVSGDSAF